ncbi:NADPH:quinone reductase [Limibaculum sp. FT325]|uniref:NADPH:quinone reductase n=1 Tax=Thermohalobaculum sediminis TaxID=2939436 RepID=UPI0020C04DB1|nr:NADPH:quinone reductase [Limibaculum sediminis]MCL5777951.1 NADPH:quinone reductase [Limibaculum sediminis]
MRAAIYRRFGPAREVLEIADLPTPDPAPGEVVVAVRASGVNPSDVKLRAGSRPGATMGWDFVVPHSDGAGEIVALGDGVPRARLGQRVWIWNGQWRRQMGTAAELIALPADQAVPLPDGTSFAEGACLGIPAMTAWATVLGDGPVDGQTLLVTGGAGTVGRYAVQMARLAGARVITTVSSAAKAAHAGPADHVIDYRREDVAERVLEITGGRGVDRIVEVDFGANLDATTRMIAEGGTIAAYASAARMTPGLPFYPLMFRNVRLWMALVYLLDPARRRRGEADLARWLDAGALSHAVASTHDLDRVADAHVAVEAGEKLGTVVVTL